MGIAQSTDADDMIRTYASAAVGRLMRVLNEASTDLGLEDTEDVGRLMRALSAAFVEGIRVGESEALAQAVEQGVNVQVRRVAPSGRDTGTGQAA